MLIIRKIGKTLRGQAKPYQIVSAAILGCLIGFAPPLGIRKDDIDWAVEKIGQVFADLG